MKPLLTALKPAAPGLLYVGGMAAFVTAGFLLTVIAGFIALGVSLLAVGYMAEVNQ